MIPIEGPVWKNCCGHTDAEYVGSFGEWMRGSDGMQSFDLYVFDSAVEGQSCCIRNGNEPNEYWSPGNPTRVLGETVIAAYRGAAEMLRERGQFRWERKSIASDTNEP